MEVEMIVLISVQKPELDSLVEDRFGRADWFVEVDTETMEWQAFENTARSNRGGAGVAAAQFAADHNALAVISGDFGPNATGALQAAGIQMARFPRDNMTGREVVQLVRQGELIVE
jgi:predicted Fe-Mo cluster-binding NifX family protein